MRSLAKVFCFFVFVALLFPAVSSAQDSFFDIWTELAVPSAPPYPNAGHQCDIAHMGSGSLVNDGDLTVILTQCNEKASGLDYPTDMMGYDSGAGVGDFAVDSFFDIIYKANADTTKVTPCDFCIDSFFDITFSYTGVSGAPGALASLHTGFPTGDVRRYFDVYFVDSFFDITYEIDFEINTRHRITVHGSVPPEQRITNVSIALGNPGTVDSFFDVFVDISPISPSNPSVPVLSLKQTGLFNPQTVPVDNSTWGHIKSLYE